MRQNKSNKHAIEFLVFDSRDVTDTAEIGSHLTMHQTIGLLTVI